MRALLISATSLAFLTVSALFAQETRSVIFGRVTDPQNSAVTGATVVVTNTDTNSVMTLTANDTGYYEANLLLPGNYRVVAEILADRHAQLFRHPFLLLGSRRSLLRSIP